MLVRQESGRSWKIRFRCNIFLQTPPFLSSFPVEKFPFFLPLDPPSCQSSATRTVNRQRIFHPCPCFASFILPFLFPCPSEALSLLLSYVLFISHLHYLSCLSSLCVSRSFASFRLRSFFVSPFISFYCAECLSLSCLPVCVIYLFTSFLPSFPPLFITLLLFIPTLSHLFFHPPPCLSVSPSLVVLSLSIFTVYINFTSVSPRNLNPIAAGTLREDRPL